MNKSSRDNLEIKGVMSEQGADIAGKTLAKGKSKAFVLGGFAVLITSISSAIFLLSG